MKPLIGLIFDLETDSKFANSCNILEFGMVQYDFNNDRILTAGSYLIKPHSGFYVNPEAEQVNKISDEVLAYACLNELSTGFLKVRELQCQFACAHNGFAYDFKIMDRYGYKFQIPVIDSYKSLKHESGRQRLEDLCYWYKVPNFAPHSALGDCLALTKVLRNYIDQIEAIIKKP